jgi:acyl-[acyl-carrier-protein]-phospholipid O-acyltransferase/long-chain-fatty-acid--[acyl-carrier-protein] ligase
MLRSLLKKSVNWLIIRKFSSYTYLNLTQFLGALNDNIYKLLIVYFLIQIEGSEASHKVLALTGAIFVLPFILFSASSGMLADRYSKRNIIIFTKLFEVGIMVAGVFAFHYEVKWGLLGILFCLATHSAIFAPSKYGILPEIVSSEKITQANGIMTSFTFLAIILGTFIASFILDVSDRNFIAAAILCSVLSLIGFLASLCIEYTDPAGSTKRFNVLFLKEIYSSLKLAQAVPSLLTAVLGSAFFLFLGAFTQLNIIPYAIHSIDLSDVQGGYLFLLTALGIGTGSILAGKISGKTVELGLVPIAAFGVMLACYSLDIFSHNLIAVIPTVLLLGLFGGMYQIPMDSFVQLNSPHDTRGQIVAAANFMSFVGVLLASALIYSTREIFGLTAAQGFSLMGTITLSVGVVITYQLFDYVTRFVAMILSCLHFSLTYHGLKNIPEGPAIYICNHQAWNETLILLGSQRRRIRFFIEDEKDHSLWMKKLYRLLRVVFLPAPEPLSCNLTTNNAIVMSLSKGISVCVFVSNPDVKQAVKHFEETFPVKDIPIIPVIIEQGTKGASNPISAKMFRKFRVPAAISFG